MAYIIPQKKTFVPVLLCVMLFFLQGLGAAWHDSPTYDEPLHLTAGYVYWKTGRNLVDITAPPLARLLAATPLLFMPLDLPNHDLTWKRLPEHNLYVNFIYGNRVSPDIMIFLGRIMILLLGIFLIWAIYEWTFIIFGAESALAAILYASTCPPLLATAHIITTDFAFTVAFFLTLMAFWCFLRHPQKVTSALVAGIALGVSFNTKYSAMLLLVILPLLFIIERPWESQSSQHLAKGIGIIAVTSLLCCVPFYGFQWAVASDGLRLVHFYSNYGWPDFLFGHFSYDGWPWYFAAVLLVKTPSVLLALSIASFALVNNTSERRFLLIWIGLSCLLFLILASFSRIQVGVRHILPMYPLLCMAAGALTGRWMKERKTVLLAGGVLACSLAGSVMAYPNYIAYFNLLVGGSANGYHVLADSNCDWGQELKALAIYLQENHSCPIYLSYFGNIDPMLYGIRYQALAPTIDFPLAIDHLVDVPNARQILLAVSATNRQGIYYKRHDLFGWLNTRHPLLILGHTLFVYDITHDSGAHREMARIYAERGFLQRAARELDWAKWIESGRPGNYD